MQTKYSVLTETVNFVTAPAALMDGDKNRKTNIYIHSRYYLV